VIRERLASDSIGAVAIAVLLVSSMMLGAVGPAVATPGNNNSSGNGNGNSGGDSPAGLTSIPNSNVRDNFGSKSSVTASTADFQGSVMSSAHPETTEVLITTANRVLNPVGKPVGEPSELILQISDDTNHEGREIAIPMRVIRQNHAKIPETVHGFHESGERWTSEVRREGSLLIFDVPKFSTNTVTFSGSVELAGTPSDETPYQYDLDDLDEASDPTGTLTGATATEWDNVSASGLGDGDSLSVDPAGHEIRGPASGEPEVVFTGDGFSRHDSDAATDLGDGESMTLGVDGNLDPTDANVTFTGKTVSSPGGTSKSVKWNLSADTDGYVGIDDNTGATYAGVGSSGAEFKKWNPDGTVDWSISTSQHRISGVSVDENSNVYYAGYDDLARSLDSNGNQRWEATLNVNPTYIAVDETNGVIYASNRTYVAKIDRSDGSVLWQSSVNTAGGDIKGLAADNGYFYASLYDAQSVKKYDSTGSVVWTESLPSHGEDIDLAGDRLAAGYYGGVALLTTDGTTQWTDGSSGYYTNAAIDSYGNVYAAERDTGTVWKFDKDHNQLWKTTGLGRAGGLEVSEHNEFVLADQNNDDVKQWSQSATTTDPGVDLDGDGTAEASYGGELSDGSTVTKSLSELSKSTDSATALTNAGSVTDIEIEFIEQSASQDPAVDLDGDGTNEVAYSGTLKDGETVSYQASSLSPGDDTATVSTANGSTVGVEVRLKEITQTTDPEVWLNGEKIESYPGTLDPGETHNFSASSSSLQNGTNEVNISVGDGSLSSDAPTPQVGFDYEHDAAHRQEITVRSEIWTDKYNVSKTWSSDRTDAELSTSLASNVVAIRDVEHRINNTTWDSVPSSDYNLSGSDLTVALGDVKAGSTHDVRINASKVRIGNGAIEVTQPTLTGGELNTTFEITNKTEGFYIDVSGTDSGNFQHYMNETSWTSVEAYTEHTSTGDQYVYLPNAAEGSTAHIKTLPFEVEPESNDVMVEVANASALTFDVRPGDSVGDDVAIRYHDTVSGDEYVLYSETDEVVRDSATAESPVTLWTDDSEDLLRIFKDDSTTSSDPSTGDSDGPGSGPVSASTGPLNSVPVVILAAILGVTGVGLALRRFVDRQIYVLGGTSLAALVAIVGIGEGFSPGIILGPIGENLGRMTPVITIVGVSLAGYYFYVRFIRGYGPGYRPGGGK